MDSILSKGIIDALFLFIWVIVSFIMEVHGPPKVKSDVVDYGAAYSMFALISASTISSQCLSGCITSQQHH